MFFLDVVSIGQRSLTLSVLQVPPGRFRIIQRRFHLGRPGKFLAPHTLIPHNTFSDVRLTADTCAFSEIFFFPTQTLGDVQASDGRLNGTLNVTTIDCDQTANTCSIPVPAPGFALVFLTSDALDAVSPTSTVTFPTTAASTSTATHIYIDPNMLATSYGHSGMRDVRGATSLGSFSSALSTRCTVLSSAFALLAAALGVLTLSRRW